MCVCTQTSTLLLPRLLCASEEGYTESYIICPAAIVGPGTGPVPSASVFFNFMTQLALGFKKAIYVGEGSNIFYAVRGPPFWPEAADRRRKC